MIELMYLGQWEAKSRQHGGATEIKNTASELLKLCVSPQIVLMGRLRERQICMEVPVMVYLDCK